MSCADDKGSSGAASASGESCDCNCENGAGGNGPGGNGAGGNGDDGYVWWTAPFDARFPNMNQAKHCYVYFLDYQRCIKAKGNCDSESGPCEYFKKVWKSLCPNDWTRKWTEQIEKGTFAGRI